MTGQISQQLDGSELAALRALAVHETYAAAAASLCTSATTLSRRLTSACVKLGAERPSDALVLAWRTDQLQAPSRPKAALRAADQQMLDMLAAGRTYGQMKQELGLSNGALTRRLSSLYNALDVSARVQALYRGMVFGYISKETPS